MEIEAKFRVPDGMFETLLTLHALGPFQLSAEPQPELQHNVYYDTSDQRLRASRHGLRIRHIGERQIATLKGQATFEDGLYTRGEWEADVSGDDPRGWPAGELRDRVLGIIGDMPLQPILEIRTTRHHIYASHADARFAELSLDQGMFLAGSRSASFRELEVELLHGGDREAFDTLVRLLRERFPLTPESRSKLERGLSLSEDLMER